MKPSAKEISMFPDTTLPTPKSHKPPRRNYNHTY